MTHPARFSHAVLRSYDAKSLVDWYVAVLDGHVIFEGSGLAFMTYDNEHHRLGVMQHPGDSKPNDAASPGLFHLAYAFNTIEDLVSTYARLRDIRIYPRLTVNHGLTLSLYYQDPDGNNVELLVDLLSPEAATDMMKSPFFEKNPVGLLIDPEDLVEVKGGLTPDRLTETYRQTEIEIPAVMAEIGGLQGLSDQEFAEQFEKRLASRSN